MASPLLILSRICRRISAYGVASCRNPKLGALVLAFFSISCGTASASIVTFTQLTGGLSDPFGITTGVFKADLSGLGFGQITSVKIRDNSSGLAGSPGQFSGFDLDAIRISTIDITDAGNIGLLTQAANLDFNNSIFIPGTQAPPIDPKLYGTGPTGTTIDTAVATLDLFDVDGFVSLGNNGLLTVNLLAPIGISNSLFLYIGEAGNNGEVAASNIGVSSTVVSEPTALSLLLGSLLLLLGAQWNSTTNAEGTDHFQKVN